MEVRKIRITRAIIISGEHVEEGAIVEVPPHVAHGLIGADCAVIHLEDGEELDPAPTSVNRMEHPQNADPQTHRVTASRGGRKT